MRKWKGFVSKLYFVLFSDSASPWHPDSACGTPWYYHPQARYRQHGRQTDHHCPQRGRSGQPAADCYPGQNNPGHGCSYCE